MEFKKVIQVLGSQCELARLLGVTKQSVHLWSKEDTIPQKYAIAVLKELKTKHIENESIIQEIETKLFR